MTREEMIDEAVRRTVKRLGEIDSSVHIINGRMCDVMRGDGLARLLEGCPTGFGHCGLKTVTYRAADDGLRSIECYDEESPSAALGLAGAHVKMIRANFQRISAEAM